jgi:hypothetical protein
MKSYKGKLELINHSANEMFEQMKAIYKLVNNKIVDIEKGVTQSEAIFSEEVKGLMDTKQKNSNSNRN